jgi:hypothetical protein
VGNIREDATGGQDNKTGGCVNSHYAEIKESLIVLTSDEMDIIREWRKIKEHKFGCITVTLNSNGTEYLMDIGNKRKGKVCVV